jgi:hypothetical protein
VVLVKETIIKAVNFFRGTPVPARRRTRCCESWG